jgi:hypothetical protein
LILAQEVHAEMDTVKMKIEAELIEDNIFKYFIEIS